MRSEKGQIKRSRKDRVWWSLEGKEEKERKVWAYRRHITFVTRKIIGRMTTSLGKVAKKKG